MNTRLHERPRKQDGYALVTAIVFLVLLTIVALAAIRGTGLEVKSTANNTLRAEAFSASEIARTLVGRQIDVLCANAGLDGLTAEGAADSEPAAIAAVPGLTINDGGNWCLETTLVPFAPTPVATNPDATYIRSTAPVANGAVWVQRLYRSAAPGAGQAQASGYGGTGIGAASGGGNVYFHVYSLGTDQPFSDTALPEAGYSTAAVYRYVIRR